MLQIKIQPPRNKGRLIIESIKVEIGKQFNRVYMKRLKTLPALQSSQIFSPSKIYHTEDRPYQVNNLLNSHSTPLEAISQLKIRSERSKQLRWKHIENQEYKNIRRHISMTRSLDIKNTILQKEGIFQKHCLDDIAVRQIKQKVFIRDVISENLEKKRKIKSKIMLKKNDNNLKTLQRAQEQYEYDEKKLKKYKNFKVIQMELEMNRPKCISIHLPKIIEEQVLKKSKNRLERYRNLQQELLKSNSSCHIEKSIDKKRQPELSPWQAQGLQDTTYNFLQ